MRQKAFTEQQSLILSLILLAVVPQAQSQEADEERLRTALIEYFRPYQFFPVLVNYGYTLGDVIDIDGVTLRYRGRDCFPSLKSPHPGPMSLFDDARINEAGINFGLRLRRLFGAAGDLGIDREIRIHFDDVTVVAATLKDIRSAYNRGACPELEPLLTGSIDTPRNGDHPYFIVSAIMFGKHTAVIRRAGSGRGTIEVQKVASLAGDANLQIQARGADEVSLTSRVAIPIAVKPVTVPKVVRIENFELRGVTTDTVL
jgi:hypothetical protein